MRTMKWVAGRPATSTVSWEAGYPTSMTLSDPENRVIGGLILPWGEVGHTSHGPVTCHKARTAWDDQIILNVQHDPDRPIGRSTRIWADETGLWATFLIADTAAGDEALREHAAGMRPGLSVEMVESVIDKDGHQQSGRVVECGMVRTPAFASALQAAQQDLETTPVVGEDTTDGNLVMIELYTNTAYLLTLAPSGDAAVTASQAGRVASTRLIAEALADAAEVLDAPAETLVTRTLLFPGDGEPAPLDISGDVLVLIDGAAQTVKVESYDPEAGHLVITAGDETIDGHVTLAEQEVPGDSQTPAEGPASGEPAPVVAAAKTPATPASRVKASANGTARVAGVRRRGLDTVVSEMAAAFKGQYPGNGRLTAALTDIVDTGTNGPGVVVGGGAVRPAWIGELWDGVDYEAQFYPLIQKPGQAGELTGMRARGFAVSGFDVQPYAGNKTPIPGLPGTITPIDVAAQRVAGGVDIDRAFYDFGEEEVVRAVLRQGAASVKRGYDQAALAAITSAATQAPATGDALEQIIDLAMTLREDSIAASFALVPFAQYKELLKTGAMEKLAYLTGDLGLTGGTFESFQIRPAAVPGVTVGSSAAVDFRTIKNHVIVQAEHLALGGVDNAIFGYYAALTVNRNAVLTTQV